MSFGSYSFDHCIVCPSIYGFRLLHWYLQTFLIKLTNMIRTIIKQILTNQKQKSLYEKGVFEEYHIPRALKNKYVSMSYVITVYIVMKKAILPFTSRYTIFYQHQLIMIIYCPEFIYQCKMLHKCANFCFCFRQLSYFNKVAHVRIGYFVCV